MEIEYIVTGTFFPFRIVFFDLVTTSWIFTSAYVKIQALRNFVFLFYFPSPAGHDNRAELTNWPPFFGLATNSLNVRNNAAYDPT